MIRKIPIHYYSMMELKDRGMFFIRAFFVAARNFIWDDCLTVSSSISFVFLLSIIPFSALFLFLMNTFKKIFFPTLFSQNMTDILVQDIAQFIPFISKEWIYTHLINSVGLKSFTTINLLMLPIISGLLFKSLDEAFRRIFHLERRHLIKGHLFHAATSVLVILGFFMINFIWTVAADATLPLVGFITKNPYLHDVYATIIEYFTFSQGNILSLLILMLFFLVTARLFLTVPIKWHHRLLAGGLFGVSWLAAREVFGLYINHITRFNVLFGSLSSVLIILLWIFYSSIALLYSVEFMYVLHSGRFKIWSGGIRPSVTK